MHYFIDGYNMLFRLLHVKSNLQHQREQIIQDLNQKIALVKLDISIVFDATFQVGERSRSHYNHVEILFTAEGETADDYILEAIKHSANPRQETVVTSDKTLAWLARQLSSFTETVEEFIQKLNRLYKNKLEQLKTTEQSLHPTAPSSKPISTSLKPLVSLSKANLDAWQHYYEQIFEMRYKEGVIEKKKNQKQIEKTHEKLKKKYSNKPTKSIESTENESKRWLKAFEERWRKLHSEE
jgi:predicted RNA-binding protein with PIN domain